LFAGYDVARYAIARAKAEGRAPTLEVLAAQVPPTSGGAVMRASQALMLATAYGLSWPVAPGTRVTSPFGWRNHPILGRRQFHTGVDLAVPEGTQVKAVADGVVRRASEDAVNGRVVIVDHGRGVSTAYCHNSRLLVVTGMRVKAGDVIAESGTTGRSTGPHLHYQLELGHEPVDPLAFGGSAPAPVVGLPGAPLPKSPEPKDGLTPTRPGSPARECAFDPLAPPGGPGRSTEVPPHPRSPRRRAARVLHRAAMSTTVTIRVRRVRPSELPLPSYQTPHAAGLDLLADVNEPVTLEPMERRLIPTGLAIELPEGFEAQVRPRSGLALEQGLTCLNAPGTIDADYRGEVRVLLVNLSREPSVIRRGDRVAQLVVAPVTHATLVEVDALSDTVRGAGGFGSTGVGR
jgi:deoxyuridine 5'-triphosphate nucleotidohydrolase